MVGEGGVEGGITGDRRGWGEVMRGRNNEQMDLNRMK